MEKLRFKQEDGTDYPSWTKMKLGDGISVSEQVPLGEHGKLLTVKLRTKGVESSTAQTLKKGATTFYQRRAGQLIYGKQNLFNGSLAIVPSEFDGYGTSKDIPAFDVDEAVMDTCFLYQFLAREAYYSSLEKISVGTGSKRISEKVFLSIEEEFPSLPEQSRIATFLGLLDERMEAQRVLVSGLEQEKRGYMQAMLSPAPTLRFKQDDGTDYPEWEEASLEDALFKYREVIRVNDDSSYTQVTISNSGHVFKRGIMKGSKIGRKRQFQINTQKYPHSMAFIRQGIFGGGIGVIPRSLHGAIVTENMPLFSVLEGFSVDFLGHLVRAPVWKRAIGAISPVGTAQKSIHEKDLLKLRFSIPSLPEQKKIAAFLDLLDERLSAEKTKLSALEQEKKAFAQRVFL